MPLLLLKQWVGMGGISHSRTWSSTWQHFHHWSPCICRIRRPSWCQQRQYRQPHLWPRACLLKRRRRPTIRWSVAPAAPQRSPQWSSRGALAASCMSWSERSKSPSAPNARTLISSISLMKAAGTITLTATRGWGRNDHLAKAWILFHLYVSPPLICSYNYLGCCLFLLCFFFVSNIDIGWCVSLLFFLLVLARSSAEDTVSGAN